MQNPNLDDSLTDTAVLKLRNGFRLLLRQSGLVVLEGRHHLLSIIYENGGRGRR